MDLIGLEPRDRPKWWTQISITRLKLSIQCVIIVFLKPGDIKKGLKRSRRLNIWRRLKSKDTRIALQGYEKTSGGKNIFKAIQRVSF